METHRLGLSHVFLILVGVLLLTNPASAQDAGIGGIVTDDTGGVLPGVTVTAASPALTEQQRIAITDGEGRYAFTQLRVGTYSVTFSLPGFNQVLREGILLDSGFTANVNAELGVGGIEETITVTGASPVVDIQNVRRQSSIDAEALATLPVGMKHVNNLITVTPGFTGLADVGGRYSQPGNYHGKEGTKVAYDGMGIENSSGNSSYQINSLSVQEFVAQTSGIGADTNADGARHQHHSEGRREHLRYDHRRVLHGPELRGDEPFARAGSSERPRAKQNDQDVRPGVQHRRSHCPRQAVVLRCLTHLGLLEKSTRGDVEPEHVPGGAADRPAEAGDATSARR